MSQNNIYTYSIYYLKFIYKDFLKIFNNVGKNVFNQDEKKIQFALGNRVLVFGRARKPRFPTFICL